MMDKPDFGYINYLINKINKPKKARFRIVFSQEFKEGFYLAPLNFEAETIHLMKIYGHTNTGRRFKE